MYIIYIYIILFSGISYPTPLHQIDAIEQKNNISINIFRLDNNNKEIWPFRPSKIFRKNPKDNCNLLQLVKDGRTHYVLISNLKHLVYNQMKNVQNKTWYICYNCLFSCVTKNKYYDHIELCYQHKAQKITLPKKNCPQKGNIMSYIKNQENNGAKVTEYENKSPFVFYFDAECILAPTNNEHDSSKTGTTVVDEHIPSACGYHVARHVIYFLTC